MCTRLYPGLARKFAFAVWGESLPGRMRREHFAGLATQLRMKEKFVLDVAGTVADRLPSALDSAIDRISLNFRPGDEVLADRLRRFVRGTTRRMSARILAA